MRKLAVMEMPGEKIAQEITNRIEDIRETDSRAVILITEGKNFELLSGMEPDILVLSSKCTKRPRPDSRRVKCKVLLLPGGAAAENIEADYAVSYGMSGRNSITLSSIKEEECILTLQRDVLTLDGTLLERQDIAVRRDRKTDTEEFMAIMAALLILGIPPEKIV